MMNKKLGGSIIPDPGGIMGTMMPGGGGMSADDQAKMKELEDYKEKRQAKKLLGQKTFETFLGELGIEGRD